MSDYELSYLPLFYDDLMEQVNYIFDKLGNPKAANDLVDAVDAAILERLPNAESFEKYPTVKKRRYPYYAIYVGEHVISFAFLFTAPVLELAGLNPKTVRTEAAILVFSYKG